MKAALLVEPGKIEVGEVPEPDVGPSDVRIAVHGVGLCGSDLSVFSGRWAAPSFPWVMGHEAFGTVEAVGEDVPSERIGQMVAVEPNVACFSCSQCQEGRTSACEVRQSVGMNRQGALAERLVVPSRFAWPLSGVSDEDMVCVEPTTVVLAALRRLGTSLPGSALVIGVGAQGLLMSLVLVGRGVDVHAYDVNRERAAFAETIGANTLGLAESKRPFQLVVDTVGSPASVEVAIDRLAVGGTLLVLGLDSRPFELTAQTLVRRQAVLRGSLTYDHPADFEATLEMIVAGRLAPGRIVSDEYPLEDTQLAFDRAETARGKTWIRVSSTR